MPSSTIFRSDSAVVETALSQVRLNPEVKDATFRFTAPPGVDVIPLN
jgi:outer membrane lipoprotein-sorting protein